MLFVVDFYDVFCIAYLAVVFFMYLSFTLVIDERAVLRYHLLLFVDFVQSSFNLTLSAWDMLCYFIVALHWSSI